MSAIEDSKFCLGVCIGLLLVNPAQGFGSDRLHAIHPFSITEGFVRLSTWGHAKVQQRDKDPLCAQVPKGIIKAMAFDNNRALVARSRALDTAAENGTVRNDLPADPLAQLRRGYISEGFEIGILHWTDSSFQYMVLSEDSSLRDFTDWCVIEDRLVLLATDNTVRVIYFKGGKTDSYSIDHAVRGRNLSLAAKGSNHVLISTSSGYLLEVDTLGSIRELPYRTGMLSDLAYIPSDDTIAYSKIGTREVILADYQNGAEVQVLPCTYTVLEIIASDNDGLLAAVTTSGFSLFDTGNGKMVMETDFGPNPIAVAFRSRSQLLVSQAIYPNDCCNHP